MPVYSVCIGLMDTNATAGLSKAKCRNVVKSVIGLTPLILLCYSVIVKVKEEIKYLIAIFRRIA